MTAVSENGFLRRFWLLLRSRKVAVWAIIAVVVYAAVATTISDRDGNWEGPYRSVAFLAITGFLAVSTGACAWERTRGALRNVKTTAPSSRTIERLRESPQMVVSAGDRAEADEVVAKALRGLRLKVYRHEESMEARGGRAGALGSPLFHWSLTLLFVVIALGQLTRTEGIMGVMADSSKPDVLESYGAREAGPMARYTGRIIGVGEILSSYMANGVDQGITPYVEVRSADGADVLASGYAYPNHPIRYRSMLVHINNDGLAAEIEIASAEGAISEQVLLDYNSDRTQVEPQVLGIAGASGEDVAALAIEPAEGSTIEAPAARVRVAYGDNEPLENPQIDVQLPEGGSIEIADGLTLTVLRLTKYARLSVVNDWSVYPIYALFGFALVGLVLALFAPPRIVRAVVVERDGSAWVHLAVRHSRGDPNLPARVEAALTEAFGREELS